MKYYWKVWLWENGKRSKDYTDYLVEPIFMEPHLDETLGTGEIILDRMPIDTKRAFPAKTKFRIERYLTANFTDSPVMFDFIVETDQVEEYVGCPTICCHRINLIEPSAIAQGMHVDNISLTRELNDVDLNYKTTKPASSIPNITITQKQVAGSGYARPNLEFGSSSRNGRGWIDFLDDASYRFTNSFRYDWSETASLTTLKSEYNGIDKHTISFTVPKLHCKHLNGTVANTLFECPIRTTIVEQKYVNGKAVQNSQKTVVNHLYNPVNIQSVTFDNYEMYNEDSKAGIREIVNETYEDNNIGGGATQAKAVFFNAGRLGKYPAIINTADRTHTSRTISFTPSQLTQTEINSKVSYVYLIKCQIEPYQSDGIIKQFTKTCTLDYESGGIFVAGEAKYSVTQNDLVKANANDITITANFVVQDNMGDGVPIPYLVKPAKYNCYDLIRKAMLTVDAHIINNSKTGLDSILSADGKDTGIQYPISIALYWADKLKRTQLHETVFENKNLWELLLQIGYYIHAIPNLTFAEDGTDRLVLNFRQLGKASIKPDSSSKITVFNSQNLSEYYTQLDCYVTNMFSPQNEVDEWIVPKTTDSAYLVSNDTAELVTKYNISEIVEFDIVLNGKTESAINYIFEKTVYNVLSVKAGILPNKGAALYYDLGSNVIGGLNYVPPEKNQGDALMSLKRICNIIFGISTDSLKFNDLRFHIKYKTQDSMRISQFKPNIREYIKNSCYEKYPHHEQFYGQQDKIIDSERFSANLWGRLVRTANNVIQSQEYAVIGGEKECGDLVQIDNEAYYVVSAECEYYANAILQKVTYSKNYNQISQVVTIPSEPRFYEISERSIIRREVRLYDFIQLSAAAPKSECGNPIFMNSQSWVELIQGIVFNKTEIILPNFAYVSFIADRFRLHKANNNTTVPTELLFPSSDTVESDNSVAPMDSSENRSVIVPVLHFPLRNALAFEWDMDDNFKAGDAVNTKIAGSTDNSNNADKAYYSLLPARYCDVFGKADLFRFRLFNKTDWTTAQTQRLPFADSGDFVPAESDSTILLPEPLVIGLDKDNREALSFNYQINLLYDNDFITYPNLFGKKTSALKMMLLNHQVSMFEETTDLSSDSIVADNVEYSFEKNINGAMELVISQPSTIDLEQVKSIILYDMEDDNHIIYIARNVGGLTDSQKLQSWYIYPIFNE